jgi:hypothetical protein
MRIQALPHLTPAVVVIAGRVARRIRIPRQLPAGVALETLDPSVRQCAL